MPDPSASPITTPPTFSLDLPTNSGGLATPEASTWVMTIFGLATLGLFKRRRFAAALKAMRS